MVLLFLIIVLLKVMGVVDVFGILPSKYYFIPLLAFWIIVIYRYYSKGKALEIIEKYEQKPPSERRIWRVVTITCFILPIIIIALLLKK